MFNLHCVLRALLTNPMNDGGSILETIKPFSKRYGFETAGMKLLGGAQHIREFKFSILEDAGGYGEGLSGEQILLQGVVDCALVEQDGITVVDFKTDYVTDATLSEVLARYRPQVDTYSRALERIYETPVKGTYLYFFHLKKLIAV